MARIKRVELSEAQGSELEKGYPVELDEGPRR